jgi:hypothetical protein
MPGRALATSLPVTRPEDPTVAGSAPGTTPPAGRHELPPPGDPAPTARRGSSNVTGTAEARLTSRRRPTDSSRMSGFLVGYLMGSRAASRAAAAAASMPPPGVAESRVLSVDERVDRLSLIVEAIWELLEESGYSEEALEAKVAEIDARDGRVDGKARRPPVRCSSCGASSPAGRATCQMCGDPLTDGAGAFRSV